MNDGDWICSDPNCGNINFARRVSCYRCNKERPDGGKPFKKKLGTEIGKSAAEKSRGLFNADDWQCNKCANVNWARRHTCNVCNAPKFGEVEARTGYGGGYNERGVVEYRRREPSSDDEYDEFGRKKRKRKHEHQDKVGITEGAAFKKLPATMLQKEKLEPVMPGPAPKIIHANKEREKISGSLSDGSVCDLPPLSKVAFRRHQLQNQTKYDRQDQMSSGYKHNGLQPQNFQSRKRYSSATDRDPTGSSGYDTASKKSKRESSDSPVKAYDPVMENRVSSTNNGFVYKFTGPTPREDFQVTYTLEERVRAAAFALVYNNCKITTEKFEWLFDKPAPDFKTIFSWRQRLLTTGCLVDSHVDKRVTYTNKPPPYIANENIKKNEPAKKTVIRIPNPDEIPIISDSEDDESIKDKQVQNKLSSRQRSVSAETLFIGANDQERQGRGSSICSSGRRSQARSQTDSSNDRSRSSSQDSQDSNYPDTDSEKLVEKSTNSKSSVTNNKSSLPSRVSVHDSDSDSISYNSEDENFLSRVYGGKVKRRLKKRPVVAPAPPAKQNNYITNETHNFPGYSTAKPSVEQSPLVTGNIYTSNLRNMNVRNQDNVIDIDGCSSEYIPTKLGSTTKNYQEFKNNVRRKGYWAKGNGTTLRKSITISNEPITRNQQIKPIYPATPQNTNFQHFYNIGKTQNVSNIASNQNIRNASIAQNVKTQNIHNAAIKKAETTNSAAIQNMISTQKVCNTSSIQNDQNITNTQVIYKSNDTKLYTNKSPQKTFTSKSLNLPEPKNILPENCPSQQNAFVSAYQNVAVNESMDLSSEDIDDQCLPFNKSAHSTPNVVKSVPENTSRIFDVVQSNNSFKNKSILDIFMNDDQVQKSPENNNDFEKYNGVHKMFETSWDEDDDALYKVDSIDEASDKQNNTPLCAGTQSPVSNMLYATDDDHSMKNAPKNLTPEIIQSKQEMLLGLLKDFQNEKESDEKQGTNVQNLSSLSIPEPGPTPADLSNEIICMSEEQENTGCEEMYTETIKPSKQIHVLESITIKPANNETWAVANDENDTMPADVEIIPDQNKVNDVSEDIQNTEVEIAAPPPQPQPAPVLDLANLLSGINTNTLLLALQNLQQIGQGASKEQCDENNQAENAEHQGNDDVKSIETINLTNDEDWEKESNCDGSIERELQKLDGNSGDTPFLSDIFDPGPVMPPNVTRKLNLNILSVEENKPESHKPHLNENAPVIGNFKSFALPKPIILNRLKLTVKPPEKPIRSSSGKKIRRKKKSKSSAQGEEEEEDDEEESGDEADLSKYDLWGSDEEQGNSSKADNAEKSKEGESSKEGQEKGDKNGKSASPPRKSKRSRSSSSSSSSTSSSSSSHSSTQAPKNRYDDFNLNSERESSPKGRKSRSRSRSPRSKSSGPTRRKSRDSRSAGESRSHDKEWSRERERRDRSRGARDERKERRYSRDGPHGTRARHR